MEPPATHRSLQDMFFSVAVMNMLSLIVVVSVVASAIEQAMWPIIVGAYLHFSFLPHFIL
jgi:hypothetical protein